MSRTILVVEDSQTEMAVIVTTLRSSGFTVVTAQDGEEAMNLVAASRPDLIVLDVVLPKASGYTVCRKIKQQTALKDIPVLMLSCKDQESDIYWGKKQGADAYMTKPFVPADLLHEVRGLL